MSNTITITKECPVIDVEVVEETMPTVVPKTLTIGSKEINLATISEEDKKKYTALTKSITLNDINSISNYGSDLQNQMAKYSSTFLKSARTTQTQEMGSLITDLLVQLDYVNVDDLKERNSIVRFLQRIPVIKSLVNTVDKTLKKYDSIEKQIDEISNKIQATRLVSLRDNKALQIMFDNNVQYCKQLEELIIGGKLKQEEINAQLIEMTANQDQYELYQIQDMQSFASNMDKRINDMILLYTAMKQSLMQIRLLQQNNVAISDKANSICSTTLPLWKNQLSISVALWNQKESIEAHRRVTDTTNEILRKNAELLHLNSVEVAKENERSVIDIETLRNSTQHLIDTIKEVQAIHAEGFTKRKEAEAMIATMGQEMETQLLDSAKTFKLLN